MNTASHTAFCVPPNTWLGHTEGCHKSGNDGERCVFTKEPMDLQGIGTAGNQVPGNLQSSFPPTQDKMMGFCL